MLTLCSAHELQVFVDCQVMRVLVGLLAHCDVSCREQVASAIESLSALSAQARDELVAAGLLDEMNKVTCMLNKVTSSVQLTHHF